MTLAAANLVAEDAAVLLRGLAGAIRPTKALRISEWAEGRIEIPGETGTDRPGKLSWDGFEYLIEPLDGLGPDDPTRDEAFMGSAQIAKTTVGVVATLFYSAEVPRPWGVGLPSIDEVLKYNRVKWQPIVDATPELKRKIRPVSSRDERGSTNTYKRFSGGAGLFFATGSPKALQMVSLCLAVYEETPNWEREVGGRGDPRAQIRARQIRWELAGAKTFHNSTPGIRKGKDAIEEDGSTGCPITDDFLAGDQRRLYHPCPHCGDDPDGVLLRLDAERMLGLGAGETPHFVCPACGGVIEHRHKAEMVRRCHPYRREPGKQPGGWIKTFPSDDQANPAPDWFFPARDFDRWLQRSSEGRPRSRHAWQVVSSAVEWSYIAAEHRKAEAGTEQQKIVYSQQILGLAYELTVQKADVDLLMEKRDARFTRGVVPIGYELLTGAVDLNGDWAQWTVYGFGPGSEHVVVDKGRIDGSPSEPELWASIAELIGRSFPHQDGGRLQVESWGVDSGYGTFHVYAFCNRYVHVKALDGADGWGLMPLRRGGKQKLQGPDGTVVSARTWRVGTWDLKRSLFNDAIPAALASETAARLAGKPHWPAWLERDYFEELTAEALIERQDRKTGVVKDETWAKIRRRNEELDLWVYCTALARAKGVGVPGAEPDWIELARRRTAGQLALDDLWERPATPATKADPPAEPSRGGSWDWKPRRP